MKSQEKILECVGILEVLKKVDNTGDVERASINRLRDLMYQFFVDNEKKSKDEKNKLSVWNCLGNDPIRPAINCVHFDHDNKVAVATDGKVLYVSHDEYMNPEIKKTIKNESTGEICETEFYEDIFDKYMKPLIGYKYPNYKAVIPSKEQLVDVKFKTDEELDVIVKDAILFSKATQEKKWKDKLSIDVLSLDNEFKEGVRKTLLSYKNFELFYAAGLDGWKISIYDNSITKFVKYFDNDDVLLMMGKYPGEDFNEEDGFDFC